MQIRNNLQRYGLAAILLHWILAVLIVGLFALGKYMVDLTYYDPWYKKAPDLHRSAGVTVAALFCVRLAWRISNLQPSAIGRFWEQRLALFMHRLFYLLVACVAVSGYMITTADGQAISVFSVFEIPATVYGFENQEDVAGEIHEWLTSLLIALLVLHALAALKHHFIDRDSTVRRMLGMTLSNNRNSGINLPKE